MLGNSKRMEAFTNYYFCGATLSLVAMLTCGFRKLDIPRKVLVIEGKYREMFQGSLK